MHLPHLNKYVSEDCVCGKQNSLEEYEQLLTFPSVQACTERRLQTTAERELCFSVYWIFINH